MGDTITNVVPGCRTQVGQRGDRPLLSVLPPGGVDRAGHADSSGPAHGGRRRRPAGRRLPHRRPTDVDAALVGPPAAGTAPGTRRRIPAGRTGRTGSHPPRAQGAGKTQSRETGEAHDPHRHLQRVVLGAGRHTPGLLRLRSDSAPGMGSHSNLLWMQQQQQQHWEQQHKAGFLHFHAQVFHDAGGGHHIGILDLVAQDARFLEEILRSSVRATEHSCAHCDPPAAAPPPPAVPAAAAAASAASASAATTAAAVSAAAAAPSSSPPAADDGSAHSAAAQSVGQVDADQTAADAECPEPLGQHLQNAALESRLIPHTHLKHSQIPFFY